MPLSEHLVELASKVNNWGRWGDDDEIGTANLIDPAAVLRGIGAVRSGTVHSLALPLRRDGVQVGQPASRHNPLLAATSLNERDPMAPGSWVSTDEVVTMSTCAATHIDGLSHVAYEGKIYGGRPQACNTAHSGATFAGVEKLPPIVTRALVCDIPKALDVDFLEPGFAVCPEHIETSLGDDASDLSPGDVLLIRTGDVRHYLAGDRRRYAVGENWELPGLAPSAISFFHDRNVAGVFTDTYAYESFPPPSGSWDDLLAVHMIQLRDMGLLQGQNWNFEGLVSAMGADGRRSCLLVAAGEPIVGAASAPVHPVAIR